MRWVLDTPRLVSTGLNMYRLPGRVPLSRMRLDKRAAMLAEYGHYADDEPMAGVRVHKAPLASLHPSQEPMRPETPIEDLLRCTETPSPSARKRKMSWVLSSSDVDLAPAAPARAPTPEPTVYCHDCRSQCTRGELTDHKRATQTAHQRMMAIQEAPGDHMKCILLDRLTESREHSSQCTKWALGLFTAAGTKRRDALINRILAPGGQHGVTADVLYQSLTFMVDWALSSGNRNVGDTVYARPQPGQMPCHACLPNLSAPCKTCKRVYDNHSETCRDCPAPQFVRWEPTSPETTPEFNKMLEAIEAAEGKGPTYDRRDVIKTKTLGDQTASAAWMCSIKHFPDPFSASFKAVLGPVGQLGVPGRYQWTNSQISISLVLQAIDSVLMLLSIPEYLLINAQALPLVCMICLSLQSMGEDDGEHMVPMNRVIKVLRQSVTKDANRLRTRLWSDVFGFVLPGHTLNMATDATQWMSPVVRKCKIDDINSFERMKQFGREEAKIGDALFKRQILIPTLDAKGQPVSSPCMSTSSRRFTLTIDTGAFVRLFMSYGQRRQWIESLT